MATRGRAAVIAGAMVLAAACGSSGATTASPGASTTSTVRLTASGDVLTFREVRATMPYGSPGAGSPAPASSPGGAAPASCDGGRRVTPPDRQRADAPVVLADAGKQACYLLGPTLLTGRTVQSAHAVRNATTGTWMVDVHFGTDDFVRKVASAEVGKQVAIIVAGEVESAPTVEPGITGRDVTIAGMFADEAAARRVAAMIDPSSAARTPRTPRTPATTVVDVLDGRCGAVAPRLGLGPAAVTSEITAEMARAALQRAHEAVPASLANLDGSERLALCEFAPTTPTTPTPTTVCPNGDIADVGEAPSPVMYAVDANLAATRMPGAQYLLRPATRISPPSPCDALSSP